MLNGGRSCSACCQLDYGIGCGGLPLFAATAPMAALYPFIILRLKPVEFLTKSHLTGQLFMPIWHL